MKESIMKLQKIFGITEERGFKVAKRLNYKAFTVPNEAYRKNRETQRKAVL